MENLDYVSFGDVAREHLDMQCQYAVRYAFPNPDRPYFGEGIRFQGDMSDYHSVRIHKDDVAKFIARFNEYRKSLRE